MSSTVPGGSVRAPATYWVAGSRSSSTQPEGAGSTSPRRKTATPCGADELGERRPAVGVEPLDAAERRDVVAVAECHGAVRSGGADREGRLRPGEGVPRHVVERVLRHRQPRIRTDRQVTQPSSFSNSDTSTSVTV